MGYFDNFYNELEEYENNNQPELIQVQPQQSPLFNNSILLKNIKDIDNMSKPELLKFVKFNFSNILKNAVNGNTDILAFTNINLLNAIHSLLCGNEINILDIDLLRFNAIAYQYITIPENNGIIIKDQNIVDKLFDISEKLNGYWLPRLKGLGLSKTLANSLIISRFSNTDMKIIVERINCIIINQSPEFMTSELILDIFKILYDIGQEWSRAFTYFMLDIPYYPQRNDLNDEIVDDMEETNSNMELAALELLNELPTDWLEFALINYAQTYVMLNVKSIRFSLQHLSNDFERVNNMNYSLRYNKNIIVP